MNSDDITAALGRLIESFPKTLSELADAFAGKPWSTVTLRRALIDLLEQAECGMPVGSDGVPVCIGDKVTSDEYPDVVATVTQLVPSAVCEGIRYTRDGSAVDEVVKYSCYAHNLRHYRSKTVEDVMAEYVRECQSHAFELGSCTDEGKMDAWRKIATSYVGSLREAMRHG